MSGGKSDLFFFSGGHVLVAPSADGRAVTLGLCKGGAEWREDLSPDRGRALGESLIRCAEDAESRAAEARAAAAPECAR